MTANRRNASGHNANQPARYRVQFKFWLNIVKDAEFALSERLTTLKASRQMKPVILQALELFFSLEDGKFSLLETLFPAVVRELVDSYQGEKIDALRDEIADLREQLSAYQATGAVVPKPARKTPKLEIIEAEADGNAVQNFMDSMKGLMG